LGTAKENLPEKNNLTPEIFSGFFVLPGKLKILKKSFRIVQSKKITKRTGPSILISVDDCNRLIAPYREKNNKIFVVFIERDAR